MQLVELRTLHFSVESKEPDGLPSISFELSPKILFSKKIFITFFRKEMIFILSGNMRNEMGSEKKKNKGGYGRTDGH